MKLANALFALCATMSIGCKLQGSQNSLKIVDGVEAGNAFSAVVKLNIGDNAICSGSFLSSSVLITAAHCLVDDKKHQRLDLKSIKLADSKISPLKIHVTNSSGRIATPDDVAILEFPKGTWLHNMAIAGGAPAAGQTVQLVGYGKASLDDRDTTSAGVKRMGTNSIREVADGLIYLTKQKGDKQQSGGAQGDSGGPLVADGKIVGIFSATASLASDGTEISLYTNLFSKGTVQFLQSLQKKGLDIPGTASMKIDQSAEKRNTFINASGGKLVNLRAAYAEGVDVVDFYDNAGNYMETVYYPQNGGGNVNFPQNSAGNVYYPQNSGGNVNFPQNSTGNVYYPQNSGGKVNSPQNSAGNVYYPQYLGTEDHYQYVGSDNAYDYYDYAGSVDYYR